MSVYVISEQTGLDGFWVNDILAGIKSEADKKNLKIEEFPLSIRTDESAKRPVVLVVGYSERWFEYICHRVRASGAEPLVINAPISFNNRETVGNVSFDYDEAMLSVVEYLKKCGKKRIAFLGCKNGRMSFDAKKQAFINGARIVGVGIYEVYEGVDVSNTVSAFIRQSQNYDAVVCSRDVEAGCLMSSLKKRGMSVPEQLYVVGFGDSKMAEYFSPSLTTVRVDYKRLGEEAVKLSQFLKQNKDTYRVSTTVHCGLVIRKSTALRPFKLVTSPAPRGIAPCRSDGLDITFLQAEELVRGWDHIDRKIVESLAGGHNTAAIAEQLFISQSSVKYRIKKMLTSANIKSRGELILLVKKCSLL